MTSKGKEIIFSVIVPTRNRTELFLDALRSVVGQTFQNIEVIVVNDGSTEPHLSSYKEIELEYPDVSFHYLVHRPNGHGQSYSMNYGVSKASGDYVCFLDDDDYWTDSEYLKKVYASISCAGQPVDLHYSNQKAYFSNGEQQTESIWVEDLILSSRDAGKQYGDARHVNTGFMLSSKGFAHLNCSVFRREFYQSIDGMDEGIRYECDRDIYIRAIDAAKMILYSGNYMSYHNIPDAKKKDNMSTLISIFEKRLYQLQVYEKGILRCNNSDVIDFCCRSKNYQLKHVATSLAESGEFTRAKYYARESLLNGFNFRWLAYTSYLTFKSWINPGARFKTHG